MSFQIQDYTQEIKSIASANGCTVEVALNYFLTNLTVMHEHYAGASELNYHQLGQDWNKLTSREKVAQKRDALSALTKSSRYRAKGDNV